MVNFYMLRIAHTANPSLFNYVDNIIRSHVSHTIIHKFEHNTNESDLAVTLIKVLAKMKTIFGKTQYQNF